MHDEQHAHIQLRRMIQRLALLANGVLLIIFVVWLVLADDARAGVTSLEGWVQFKEIAGPAKGLSSRETTLMAAFALVPISLMTMLFGLFFGRRESRSLKAWLLFCTLVCGWLGAWIGRNDLYWFGHGWRVSAEVSAAARLADALDTNWPLGDGDHPELGVVLGYPKQNPVTLILAGEPVSVGELKIVAVEKSNNCQMLRFQLASPNHDTWLVRTAGGRHPGQFVNALSTRFVQTRIQTLSRDWNLVRYDKTRSAMARPVSAHTAIRENNTRAAVPGS